MDNRTLLIHLAFLAIAGSACDKKHIHVMLPPAGEQFTKVDRQGASIIPNGRLVKPQGTTVLVAPHPYGLALSPDGQVAVTANSGNRPFSVSVIRGLYGASPEVTQIPEGPFGKEGVLESVFMGLAITPDNKFLFVSGGESNKVFKFDLRSGVKVDSINLAVEDGSRDYKHGYLGDLVLSSDGSRLYVADQIGFRVAVIDTRANKLLHNVPVGRYPFGLCLSPGEDALYVANVGMFGYSLLGGLDTSKLAASAARFPTSGFGTEEMRKGYEKDGQVVPGLGDPNAPESFSVWKIDLGEPFPKVTKKIKTGFLVGELIGGVPAVGGSSPNSLVASGRHVFVSNGNNDCITAIDFENDSVVANITLSLDPRLGNLRGIIPFGLALSPDNERLYVAESGINAIGVIDANTLQVKGHIPAGWFPSKVKVSPDGRKLIVANAKGFGSGPNGGRNWKEGPEGTYVGHLMKGSVSIMDIPTDQQLEALSREVLDNNFRFRQVDRIFLSAHGDNPIPVFPGQKKSPIEHIVFISKENRTYDEVFGQLQGGAGDPSLARYGEGRMVYNERRTDSVGNVTVMPNHLALARRFSISDNFYVDSDHSADGHRWLVNTYPNEWVETSVAAAYGGKREMRVGSKAPGNLALVGASGAIYPEDYNEAGSMWDHLARNGKSFFNFGFGVEMAASLSDSTMKETGVKLLANYPLPGPLHENSSREYATYNMAIPDQHRADQFIREFKEKFLGKGKTMPQVITILLPNDHGAGDRPEAGYPFRASYMMDNDLALGRIIEFLSGTPYWNKMAVFITEDDSQDGVDHVDAHRSLLMVASPYARKNHVGHRHYSFGSIFKTFWNLLGIPYLNQYDASAQDLSDLFTGTPDFSPYRALPPDERVFDPQKALDPFDRNFDWKAVLESPGLDEAADFIESHGKRNKKNGQ